MTSKIYPDDFGRVLNNREDYYNYYLTHFSKEKIKKDPNKIDLLPVKKVLKVSML